MWGNAYKKQLKALVILQKKAIRLITKSGYNEHTSPLFRDVNILKLDDLHESHITMFMHDFVNKNVPCPLQSLFEHQTELYGHQTRHSCDPRIPKTFTDLAKRSLLYRGPYLWTYLDPGLKKAPSKKALKRQIMEKVMGSY